MSCGPGQATALSMKPLLSRSLEGSALNQPDPEELKSPTEIGIVGFDRDDLSISHPR